MAKAFFLVPMVGSCKSYDDPYRGKYMMSSNVSKGGCLRYARKNSHAVVMLEAEQSHLDWVANRPDAFRLANEDALDTPLTDAEVGDIKARLEDAFIPSGFVDKGDTRRELIRGIAGLFLFSQRCEGAFNEGWRQRAEDRGMTLQSVWSSFPLDLQHELRQVAQSFGWSSDELDIKPMTPMHQILAAISERFEDYPIFLSGFEV